MVAQKPRYSELMESGVLYFVARGKVHNDHGYEIGGGNKSTKSITSRKLLFLHIFVGGLARHLELSSIVKVARDAGKPLFCWLLGKRKEAREFHKQA